jgi:hypothetical protein
MRRPLLLTLAALAFADPLDVLTRLKRLVRKDGFLAIMCEPVGHYLNGERATRSPAGRG